MKIKPSNYMSLGTFRNLIQKENKGDNISSKSFLINRN